MQHTHNVIRPPPPSLPRHFQPSSGKPPPSAVTSHATPAPPSNPHNVLCPLDVSVLEILHKWSHTLRGLPCLAAFTENVFRGHAHCSMRPCLSPYTLSDVPLCGCFPLVIYLPAAVERLGHSHLLAPVGGAATDMHIQIRISAPTFISMGCAPRLDHVHCMSNSEEPKRLCMMSSFFDQRSPSFLRLLLLPKSCLTGGTLRSWCQTVASPGPPSPLLSGISFS